MWNVARRFSRAAVVVGLVAGVGAAAPPSSYEEMSSAGERGRVSLCGARLAQTDPDLYLPGELSAVVLFDCPSGTIRCEAKCCRCCNPDIHVCCVTLCTVQCVDECSAC